VNQVLALGPPAVDAYAVVACECARAVGLRLQAEDRHAGRRGTDRRWIGWPVGENLEKTFDRFRSSFLIDEHSGALRELGLAATVNGHIHPTERGIDLALAPSPILSETQGLTLGEQQQTVLASAILDHPNEFLEVAVVIRALASSRGLGWSDAIEGTVLQAHPDWSHNRLTAHRAAMLGRLRDLGVITLSETSEGMDVRLSDRPSMLIEKALELRDISRPPKGRSTKNHGEKHETGTQD